MKFFRQMRTNQLRFSVSFFKHGQRYLQLEAWITTYDGFNILASYLSFGLWYNTWYRARVERIRHFVELLLANCTVWGEQFWININLILTKLLKLLRDKDTEDKRVASKVPNINGESNNARHGSLKVENHSSEMFHEVILNFSWKAMGSPRAWIPNYYWEKHQVKKSFPSLKNTSNGFHNVFFGSAKYSKKDWISTFSLKCGVWRRKSETKPILVLKVPSISESCIEI